MGGGSSSESAENDGYPIGQERGPSDFLVKPFWCIAFGEECGNWTPTALLLRLARTGIQAWAGEHQLAKEGSHADRVMSFTCEGLLTVRTLAFLFHGLVGALYPSPPLLDFSSYMPL